MIPHGEPLENEQIKLLFHFCDLYRVTVRASLIEWVLHARSDGSKVCRSNPLVLLFEQVPHDTPDYMCIEAEEERAETDLGQGLSLNL